MREPDKRKEQPVLDAETVEDLELADADQIAGGFRSCGCMQ
jgi:hypothetical protein